MPSLEHTGAGATLSRPEDLVAALPAGAQLKLGQAESKARAAASAPRRQPSGTLNSPCSRQGSHQTPRVADTTGAQEVHSMPLWVLKLSRKQITCLRIQTLQRHTHEQAHGRGRPLLRDPRGLSVQCCRVQSSEAPSGACTKPRRSEPLSAAASGRRRRKAALCQDNPETRGGETRGPALVLPGHQDGRALRGPSARQTRTALPSEDRACRP